MWISFPPEPIPDCPACTPECPESVLGVSEPVPWPTRRISTWPLCHPRLNARVLTRGDPASGRPEPIPCAAETISVWGEGVPESGESIPGCGETIPNSGAPTFSTFQSIRSPGETIPSSGEAIPGCGAGILRDLIAMCVVPTKQFAGEAGNDGGPRSRASCVSCRVPLPISTSISAKMTNSGLVRFWLSGPSLRATRSHTGSYGHSDDSHQAPHLRPMRMLIRWTCA